jgi:exonuclease SbcD
LRERIGKPVPVLAMGHLMTSGAVKGGDDGVRDLYVGTLEGVDDGIFPATFDYVALGHIHRPQRVNGRDDIRYSGSPIAMGFDERCDEKVVCIVTFDGREKKIETKPVPVFQALQRVSADDVKAIKKALKTIAKSAAPVWLEVQYTGEETVRTLESDVNEILKGSLAKCIHIRNASYVQHLLQTEGIETPELCELEPAFVFESLLKQMRIEGDDAALLRSTYQEALHAVQEEEDAVSQDD